MCPTDLAAAGVGVTLEKANAYLPCVTDQLTQPFGNASTLFRGGSPLFSDLARLEHPRTTTHGAAPPQRSPHS